MWNRFRHWTLNTLIYKLHLRCVRPRWDCQHQNMHAISHESKHVSRSIFGQGLPRRVCVSSSIRCPSLHTTKPEHYKYAWTVDWDNFIILLLRKLGKSQIISTKGGGNNKGKQKNQANFRDLETKRLRQWPESCIGSSVRRYQKKQWDAFILNGEEPFKNKTSLGNNIFKARKQEMINK